MGAPTAGPAGDANQDGAGEKFHRAGSGLLFCILRNRRQTCVVPGYASGRTPSPAPEGERGRGWDFAARADAARAAGIHGSPAEDMEVLLPWAGPRCFVPLCGPAANFPRLRAPGRRRISAPWLCPWPRRRRSRTARVETFCASGALRRRAGRARGCDRLWVTRVEGWRAGSAPAGGPGGERRGRRVPWAPYRNLAEAGLGILLYE